MTPGIGPGRNRVGPVAAALFALVLASFSLGAGLALDDLPQRQQLLGETLYPELPADPNEPFGFLPGGARNLAMLEYGLVPWWTSPDLVLSFWRPLTVATHRLDYLLWPDSPAVMHLHNLAWLAAMTLAAGWLFRRDLGSGVAASLAVLLFAVDEGHGAVAGWVANRNALLAATFGIAAILLHRRARERGSPRLAIGAAGWLLLGLLSAEAAIGTLAYLVADEVWSARDRIRSRLIRLGPHLAVVAGWRIAYNLLGYGALGSGIYVDPVRTPLRFIEAAAARLPVLFLGQWAFPPAEMSTLLPNDLGRVLVPLGWGAIAIVGWLLWPLLRDRRDARFWATGSILALVPIAATFPHNRLLLFVGLGSAPLLGLAWEASRRPDDEHNSRCLTGLRRPLVRGLVVAQLITSPILFVVNAGAMRSVAGRMAETILPVVDRLEPGQVPILVTSPHYFWSGYVPSIAWFHDRPVPPAIAILTTGPTAIELTVSGERSVGLAANGGILQSIFAGMFRDLEVPMVPGRVDGGWFDVEVLSVTPDGRPDRMTVHLPEPVDSERYVWFAWTEEGGWTDLALPPIGDTVTLPRPHRVYLLDQR